MPLYKPPLTAQTVSITSNFTTASTTAVQITGLSISFTAAGNGQQYKITVQPPTVQNSTAQNNIVLTIWDGAVGTGTQVGGATTQPFGATAPDHLIATTVVAPAAGSKTYNVGMSTTGTNTATFAASATTPAWFIIEPI